VLKIQKKTSTLFSTVLGSVLVSLRDVYAQAAATAPAPGSTAAADPMKSILLNLPIILALFGLFYFGLIRPQRAQAKKHADFVSSLGKGEEVVTASGIIGNIRGLTDRVVTLEVSPGTEIKVLRSQIQSKLSEVITAAT